VSDREKSIKSRIEVRASLQWIVEYSSLTLSRFYSLRSIYSRKPIQVCKTATNVISPGRLQEETTTHGSAPRRTFRIRFLKIAHVATTTIITIIFKKCWKGSRRNRYQERESSHPGTVKHIGTLIYIYRYSADS